MIRTLLAFFLVVAPAALQAAEPARVLIVGTYR